jgi:hypothetical protein
MRRAAVVPQPRSFLDRYRRPLVVGGLVALGLLFAGFLFVGANQPAYACSTQLDPASPVPGSSALGQVEEDMGRNHVAAGSEITYVFCPPASGQHYNATNLGPIAPRYYTPDDQVVPDGFVHNLEHGALVILYNCNRGGCDSADQDQLRALAQSFPASPVCKIPAGVISPVIARFDQMKAPFAALVWGRVLFQDQLDTGQMLQFYNQYGEMTNPEQQCARPGQSGPIPSAMPLPGASRSGS